MLDKLIFSFLLIYGFFSTVSLAGGSIGLYGALLFAIIRYFKKPFKIVWDKGILLAIAFFLISLLLSALGSYDVPNTLKTVWRFLHRFFPLFLIALSIKDFQKNYKLIFVILLSVAISDVVAIWQGIHGNYRANAFVANPINLAGMLIQLIPIMVILVLQGKNLSKGIRYGLIFLTFLSFVALLFNGTRGAWLAILVTLIVYGLLKIKEKPRVFLYCICFIFLSGLIIYNVPTIKARFYSIGDLESNSSNRERVLIWKSALQMFHDHPLTGVGAGNFGAVYQKQYISPHAVHPDLNHAHNNFLHTLAETGVIGFSGFLVLFGYLVFYFYKAYRRNNNNYWGLIGLLIVLVWLLHGLTEYNLGSSIIMRLFWVLMGIVLTQLKSDSGMVEQVIKPETTSNHNDSNNSVV
ncbi:MAG TPA: O-antigen ligase family protein [Bacillota bacterium]|nr:O-antigen ligase family protein [Bacillota bacterium]